MNKKLTVRNEFGKTVYCIVSDDKPVEQQLMQVLAMHPGHGFTVAVNEKNVFVKDYRTNETVGTFEILSFTETDEAVILNWQK